MAIQDHNLQISEQEYRDLPLPSYSMLSSIDKQGLDAVGGVKQSFNLKFGSLVDMMCFEPHRVDEVFYKGSAVKPPTTNVKNICDNILKGIEGKVGEVEKEVSILGRKRKGKKISNKLSNYEREIIASAAVLKIYKSYSEEKILKSVVSAGSEYFKDKITSRGKVLIKPEMWLQASQTAATLICHPFTAKYFAQNVSGVEIIYQYKFDVEINGFRCKGMLDCLIVNHKAKLIIPVDLKTGEAACKDFPILYTAHKYHIQGALYREALKSIVAIDFDLFDYEVKLFEFIYISKLNPSKPMRFRVSEKMHNHALYGFTDRFGYKHTGVFDLLSQYYYSVENDNAQYTLEEEDSKGLLEMDEEMILGKNI